MTETIYTTQKDLHQVRKSYLKSCLSNLVFIVLLGLLTQYRINPHHLLTPVVIKWIQLLSLIPGATALEGQLGYEIASWSGNTPAEILNRQLYKWLCKLSILFPAVAFFLEP